MRLKENLLGGGLEPPCLAACAPQTHVSAISPPERGVEKLEHFEWDASVNFEGNALAAGSRRNLDLRDETLGDRRGRIHWLACVRLALA